jgi:hypothetical protein
VSKLSATHAALVSFHLCQFFFSFFLALIALFLVILSFVFPKLAAKGLLCRFAAAPPHFTSPFRLMRSARPVEVLLLVEFLRAVFTRFQITVEFSLSLN